MKRFGAARFLCVGVKHIDFVEPTTIGANTLQELYNARHISSTAYTLYNCIIENYQSAKKYDIVIAEGFLDDMEIQWKIVAKLQSLAKKDGIIIITCNDAIGYFIEVMKRLVGHVISRDIGDFEAKTTYLTTFSSHS